MNDDELQSLLESLTTDTSQIVSSPETLRELQLRNLPFETKRKSPEEYINELFAARKKAALSSLSKMPAPPDIAIATINSLYDEIRECILFGLNGAAITLSSILVEFALKHAIANHNKGRYIYDKVEWDRLENKELGPVIKEAYELSILTDQAHTNLTRFRKETRNLYLHYNIKKITADAIMHKAKVIDIKTGNVEERDLTAEDNPQIWQLAKKVKDRETVIDIFTFADSVVKYLFDKK